MIVQRPSHAARRICGLLAACAALVACSGNATRPNAEGEAKEQALRAEFEQLEQMRLASMVMLLKHALENGKAVVVSPLFNSTEKTARPGITYKDYSRTVQWQKIGDPKSTFTIGWDKKILLVTLGEVHQIDVIEPGSYRVASASFDVHNEKLPDVAVKRGLRARGVGKVAYVQTEFQEQRYVKQWRGPTYGTERVQSSYCLVAHVSGHCVSWGTRSDDVTQQTSGGRYVDRVQRSMEPGVQVTAKPSKEFASFTVQPGELVLLDAFFAKTPNVRFHRDECERAAAQQIDCELSGFDLQRIPSNADDFKRRITTLTSSPQLVELLAKTQYRAPKITALAGWSDPHWGQNYYLGAPQ